MSRKESRCRGEERSLKGRSCQSDERQSMLEVDAGYGSSMFCAGSQDPLDLDMRATRDVASEGHRGENYWNKPNDSPESNYSSSVSSDQRLGMSISSIPSDAAEDAVFSDTTLIGLNKEHSIEVSEGDQVFQTSSNVVSLSDEVGVQTSERSIESSCKDVWNQTFRNSSHLSCHGMNIQKQSKSLDRGLNSLSLERGLVPQPPPRVKSATWEFDDCEGTSVDGDLDNETESRHSSPSGVEFSSDDDSQSKSSDDGFKPAHFLTSGVRPKSFNRVQSEFSWQQNGHKESLVKRKAATLSRVEGLSSLHSSIDHLNTCIVSREKRARSCAVFSDCSKPDETVACTKSMYALDTVSCQEAGNMRSSDKQPKDCRPLSRKPSLASAQMQMLLVPQSSARSSPNLKRSQSPIPKPSRFRIPFKKAGWPQSLPNSPTPTVIPNPFLDMDQSEDSNSNCSHEASPVCHREVFSCSSIVSSDLQVDEHKRASMDYGNVFNMSTPVVQITGPGQFSSARHSLGNGPPYIRVADVDIKYERSKRRASDATDMILGMSRSSYSLRVSPEVVASHEDFNLCLDDCAENLRRRQHPHPLCQFATKGWLEVLQTGLTSSLQLAKIQKSEQKLRHDVWEVCRTECEYFCHLLNARDVYMDTMKKLKAQGHLPMVNMDQLFANLIDICLVSEKWAERLLSLFKGKSVETAGDVLDLLRIFSEFDDVVTGPYCQYSQSYARLTHLDLLSEWKADSNFTKYLTWCQQRADRISLSQVLIAPVRRFSDYVVLLKEVLKHCPPKYKPELKEKISAVESSVANLNKEVGNKEVYNIVAELQHSLQWPSVNEIERSGFYIPPGLEDILEENRSPDFLDNGDRKILYNTPVSLREAGGRVDMFLFLFDDLLLITKFNSKERSSSRPSSRQTFKRLSYGTYTVYKQPLPLDRVQMYSLPSSSGLENAFTLVHFSRFLQVIGVYTFQTTSAAEKTAWITKIKASQANWKTQLN